MSNAIHFSIVVPVYKAEKYLERCVQSVLEQTYQEFDVVLVDDGSPDNCPAMCDAYAAQDSRFHVIHKENGGALSARCAAIDYACDELSYDRHYLLFLDADDTFKPNALEVIADNIQASGCDLLIFNADMTVGGTIIAPLRSNSFVGSITDPHEKLRVLAGERYNPLWVKAIHRDLFVRRDYRDYYHIFCGEDLIESLDPVYRAKKLTVIGDRLYNYEQNPDSIVHHTQKTIHYVPPAYRVVLLNFLSASPYWTAEDARWYARWIRAYIGGAARGIGYERSTRKEKYSLWDALQNDSFYRPYLDTWETDRFVDRLVLRLLTRRFYFVLYFICAVRGIMLKAKQTNM